MQTVRVKLRTVTPLILGGAGVEEAAPWTDRFGNTGPTQHIPVELRGPSFKGLMRFWFRTLTGINEYKSSNNAERDWFGSAELGQSAVKLQLVSATPQVKLWRPQEFNNFDQGKGKQTKNGLKYLGFTLDTKVEEQKGKPKVNRVRKYIVPGHRFELVLRSSNERALAAQWVAIWLLCNLGGVGLRSRRGFGSLTIEAIDKEPMPLLDLRKQPLQKWPDSIKAGVEAAWTRLGIEPPVSPGSFPFFYRGLEIRTVSPNPATGDWKPVMNYIGLRLQESRRNIKPVSLRKPFGLPLQDVSNDRHASPLLFHVGESAAAGKTNLGITALTFYSPDIMPATGKGKLPDSVVHHYVRGLGGFGATL